MGNSLSILQTRAETGRKEKELNDYYLAKVEADVSRNTQLQEQKLEVGT